MSAKRAPRVPTSLDTAGTSLWKAIVASVPASYELDARELHILERACRCADELALLDAAVDRDGLVVRGSRNQPVLNPCLAEARQLRLAQLRLLHELKIDPPAEESPGTRAARKAAEARWGRTRQTTILKEVRDAKN